MKSNSIAFEALKNRGASVAYHNGIPFDVKEEQDFYFDPNGKPHRVSILKNIPQEMRDTPQWVLWKLEPGKDGRITKVPYQISGSKASSTNPAHWHSFEDCTNKLHSWNYHGVGFVLTEETGIVCVDLDKQIAPDRSASSMAEQKIGLLNSYTEISQSLTGFHIFVRGKKPGKKCRVGSVEVYSKSRFIAMTGYILKPMGNTCQQRQAELDTFYDATFKESPQVKLEAKQYVLTTPTVVSMSDSEIIRRAMNAKTGARFTQLWNGNIAENEHSECDAELLGALRFWTGGNKSQSFALFAQSGLNRDKWSKREDYRERTWSLVDQGEVYSSQARGQAAEQDSPQQSDVEKASLLEKLRARAYSQKANHVEPVPRFYLADVGICTAGNITTISAQAKAGKTAAIGAMIASAIAEADGDFLGFKSSNPNHHAIVTIDTEQTPYDHWKLIERARIRAGLEVTPEWLQSFCVTGFNLPEIRAALRVTLEESAKRFGGIHSLILDGAADVVPDVNDPLESNSLVAEIHALAIEFDCPAIAIIHLNPSSDFKTRGHLGSQLERKAETNLRLKKDDNEITTMWCDKNRRAPIPEKTGPRFAWSNLKSMHVSVATVDQCRTTLQAEDSIMKVMEAFRMSGKTGLHYAELMRAILSVPGVKSETTAERIYGRAKAAGKITKNIIGQWEISK